MAVDLHPDIVKAINQFARTPLGRKYGRWAKKRYNMSGKKLMAKSTAAEFGGRSTKTGRGVVSSAGARGPAQFIPTTRESYMEQYGVDPWKNDRSAFKGMALHHMNTGVEGYNPGMPTYLDLVRGTKINPADIRALRTGGTGGGTRGRSAGRRPGGSFFTAGQRDLGMNLSTSTTPPVSMEADRKAARVNLLLGGINSQSLLAYASAKKGLRDIPGSTESELNFTPGRRDITQVRLPGGGRRGPGGRGPGGPAVTPERIARGKWGGSKLAGKALVKAAGLPVSSRKRSTMHTASGGVSDHYDGNTDSYAWDMSVSGPQGTKIAAKLARMLGKPGWNGGSWLNVNKRVGGKLFRYQIGWNVAGHYDHIHMGVDRVDIPG